MKTSFGVLTLTLLVVGCDGSRVQELEKENIQLRSKINTLTNIPASIGAIEITVVKISTSLNATKFEAFINNNSDYFLDFLSLDVEIYTHPGRYLGKSSLAGRNLRSGQTILDVCYFDGVDRHLVDNWFITIKQAEAGAPGGVRSNVLGSLQIKLKTALK